MVYFRNRGTIAVEDVQCDEEHVCRAAIVNCPFSVRPSPACSAASSARAPARLVTTGLLFVSAALSIVAFSDVALEGHKYIIQILPWIHSGDFAIDWTVRVDTMTAVMLVVVTGVSSLVHLYSIGYMQDDSYRPRFFSISVAVHFRDADAGDGQQFPAAVFRLGRGWAWLRIC